MVNAVDHIELIVRDAKATFEFLTAIGMEKVRETDHHGKSYEVKPRGQDKPVIELHTAQGEENPGINHLAFEVDDLEELTEDLKADGVTVDRDPHLIEVTDRVKSNIRDPDGRRVQLVSPNNDD